MPTPLQLILVHLDATAAAGKRLAFARRIARQQGTRLAALYAATPAFVELPYAPEIGPTFAESLVAIDNERRERVLKMFDKELTLPGPIAEWMQTDEVPVAGAFAQQAMYADLSILGQHDAEDPAAATVPPDFVASVLAASGRPAIVLPHVGWNGTVGETVAVAWKESPEAARAVQASLPFLQRAKRVHVFTWGEVGPARLGGQPLDLESYLAHHGVSATWHHEGQEPGNLGEMLLSRVFDVGADLLVMGCYGHGRAREWLLGGVSRTLLHSMTLPVLMSH